MFDDVDAAFGECPEPEQDAVAPLPLVGWEVVQFFDPRGRMKAVPISGPPRVAALRAFYRGEPIPGGWVPGLVVGPAPHGLHSRYPYPLPRELVNWSRATIEIRGDE